MWESLYVPKKPQSFLTLIFPQRSLLGSSVHRNAQVATLKAIKFGTAFVQRHCTMKCNVAREHSALAVAIGSPTLWDLGDGFDSVLRWLLAGNGAGYEQLCQ
jgi:hypothetical protein